MATLALKRNVSIHVEAGSGSAARNRHFPKTRWEIILIVSIVKIGGFTLSSDIIIIICYAYYHTAYLHLYVIWKLIIPLILSSSPLIFNFNALMCYSCMTCILDAGIKIKLKSSGKKKVHLS